MFMRVSLQLLQATQQPFVTDLLTLLRYNRIEIGGLVDSIRIRVAFLFFVTLYFALSVFGSVDDFWSFDSVCNESEILVLDDGKKFIWDTFCD